MKVSNEMFPFEIFENLGYSCMVYGQKRYNGVAICSNLPLEKASKGFNDEYWDRQKRVIGTNVHEIDIVNIYAPHGDLRGTEKYHYKLEWYNEFLRFLMKNYNPKRQPISCRRFQHYKR